MLNPITQNRKYFIGYFSIWIALAFVQASLFYFLLDVTLLPSIIDSAVFIGLFSLIGFGIWPIVNFSSLERAYLSNTLLTHFAGVVTLIGLWLGASYGILHTIFTEESVYLSFLTSSMPWRIAFGAFLYFLIVLNYYLFVYNEEFRARKVNEAELKRSLKEAELSMLKSQLNPHFIFNSLNSISSLTMTNPEKAQEMVIALSEFLRYAVKPGQEELITIKSELDAIDKFVLIEKVRFGERLQLVIESESDCMAYKIPPLIVQPLVENAIKYGVHESTEVGDIILKCRSLNNILEITVSNTYDPVSTHALKTGVGLKNVRNRLKLLFDRDDLLEIRDDSGKFIVRLLIPQ